MELTLENWKPLLEDAHEFKEPEEAVRLVEKLLTLQRQSTIAAERQQFLEHLKEIRSITNNENDGISANMMFIKAEINSLIEEYFSLLPNNKEEL